MFYADANLLPLWIILGVVAIGVIVFLLRKYVPGLGFDNEPVDEFKQAEEEVNRFIVTEDLNKKVDDEDDDDEDEE